MELFALCVFRPYGNNLSVSLPLVLLRRRSLPSLTAYSSSIAMAYGFARVYRCASDYPSCFNGYTRGNLEGIAQLITQGAVDIASQFVKQLRVIHFAWVR